MALHEQPPATSTEEDGRGRASDSWLFFTKFVRLGTRVGAVVPSSRWFARRIAEGIDFDRAGCVVELGAGTGPITAELLRRAGDRCRVLVVERDPDFCGRLRAQFPHAEVIQDDATDLARLLAERRVGPVDHIVCGLALPWLAAQDRHRLLDAARRALAPHGSFRQLTYMPWIHALVYRRYFRRVGFRLVVRNIPPGGFYVCEGPRDDPAEADGFRG
jgi:phospholipid N-methyltransferase